MDKGEKTCCAVGVLPVEVCCWEFGEKTNSLPSNLLGWQGWAGTVNYRPALLKGKLLLHNCLRALAWNFRSLGLKMERCVQCLILFTSTHLWQNKMAALVVWKIGYERLGYNMMSLSTPCSVLVGARPGYSFFKNSPERRRPWAGFRGELEIWKRRDIGKEWTVKSFVGKVHQPGPNSLCLVGRLWLWLPPALEWVRSGVPSPTQTNAVLWNVPLQ